MSVPPDQSVFEDHLKRGDYRLGEKEGKWHLVDKCWPEVIFKVKAKCRKWWAIKINIDSYPHVAPKGNLWSIEQNRTLTGDELPSSNENEGNVVWQTFVKHSDKGVYAPFDREGHQYADWPSSHPELYWTNERTIAFYLEKIYDLLNSADYRPPKNP